MKKVEIDINTKGIVVFAKGRGDYDDWLVMVTKVEEVENIGSKNFNVYGHIFYNITNDVWYFSSGDENYSWGHINHWDFYEPTKEQKQFIIDALKKRGYKYVPILNKIIYKR